MAEAGQTVGNWRLVRPLGSGATAGVWLGHREDDASDVVAVKIIRPHSFENARARYERETKVLRTLNHPNIVGFRDSGDLDSERAFFLVMDMVEGEELVHTIRRGSMPPDQARALFRGLAEGLDHAHQRGIFHRDLKPENVMVRPDGSGCLIDFGIAFEEGGANLTREGMLPGTVGYFPPEVFERGARPDPRLGDIYALGLMLFETVEGTPAYPLDADLSTNQQVLRILADKMDRRVVEPTVPLPKDLAEIIKAATNPDPAKRIRTAADLVARLGGQKVAASRASSAGATLWVEADDEPVPTSAAPPTPPSAQPSASLRPESGIAAMDASAAPPASPPPVIVKVVRPPAAPPAPAPAPAAESPRWVPLALGAAGVMILLSLGIVFAVYRMSATPGTPAAATLQVLPAGDVARVRVDGVEATHGPDGWTASGLAAGPHTVTLAAGSGCGADGEIACGGCCVCATQPVTLAEGETQKLAISTPAPVSTRAVVVKLSGDLAGRAAHVRVGAVDATADGGDFKATAPLAAAVPVRVDVGTCADADADCAEGAECPAGCWSSVSKVDLVCGADPLVVPVMLPNATPEAAPAEAPSRTAAPSRPSRTRSNAKPPPTSAEPAAQALVVGTQVQSSSGVDEGKLAAAMRAMAPSLQYCWHQLPPPYASLPTASVEFKVKRGAVDSSSPTLTARTGNATVDQCILTKVKVALLGNDAGSGKAKVAISFTVK